MNNLIHRILTYVANELIVEKLSNNRFFQRFVVLSNAKFKESTTRLRAKADDWTTPSPASQHLRARLHRSRSTLGTFGSTFLDSVKKQIGEEFRKHLGGGGPRRR